MNVPWSTFKEVVNNWKIKNSIRYLPKEQDAYPLIWVNIENQSFEVINLKVTDDVTDFENNFKPESNKSGIGTLVRHATTTSDERNISAVNRIPPGYTIYPSGRADNIEAGTYGNGTKLKLTDAQKTVEFQLLEHFYAVGGRVIWGSQSSIDDEVSAFLYAPATQGLTDQAGGDYIVANSVVIVPVPAGQGNKSLDLTAKLPNTNILKCTPIPAIGATGQFDYDSDTNILTRREDGKGNSHLLLIDKNLFKFCNCAWGKDGGGESWYESADVIGKLLYNAWKIKFQFDANTANSKANVMLTLAAKKNI